MLTIFPHNSLLNIVHNFHLRNFRNSFHVWFFFSFVFLSFITLERVDVFRVDVFGVDVLKRVDVLGGWCFVKGWCFEKGLCAEGWSFQKRFDVSEKIWCIQALEIFRMGLMFWKLTFSEGCVSWKLIFWKGLTFWWLMSFQRDSCFGGRCF